MSNWNPDPSQPPNPSGPAGNQPPSNQPPSGPPGNQPPPSSPYGQPGQPGPGQAGPGKSAPSGPPQGDPRQGTSPYGGSAPGSYQGAPFNGGAYDGPTGSLKRPGTVSVAVLITWVFSALAAVGSVIGIVMALTGAETIESRLRDVIEDDPDLQRQLEDAGADSGDISAAVDVLIWGVVAVLAVLLIWSLIAFVLATFTRRGSNGARITLVVSCVMTMILSLVFIAALFTALSLIAALAVVVLLFTGGANDWFKNKKIAKLQGR